MRRDIDTRAARTTVITVTLTREEIEDILRANLADTPRGEVVFAWDLAIFGLSSSPAKRRKPPSVVGLTITHTLTEELPDAS